MRTSNRKNVQVIDGALNCAYDIFSLPVDDFRLVFPSNDQDVEFVEDFFARDERVAQRVCESMWTSRVDKKSVQGIHGTLFYGLEEKKVFYPTKRENEMVTGLSPVK